MPANGSVLSGHAVAGLIDAEAHFRITEQNGGGSLSCAMVLAMRDDAVDLLIALADFTGLGVVASTDNRGNPQSAWRVYRKHEAAALAGFLTRFPLRSRKRLDFEIWRTAVEHWQSRDADRFERMAAIRQGIRASREYRDNPDRGEPARIETDGLADWLGAFIAGDGHFGISKGATRLTVRLRADDAPLLIALRAAIGVGTISGPYANRAARPSVVWTVTRTSELLGLIELLDGRVPGRKRLEFETWKGAVVVRADRSRAPAERRRLLVESERELKRIRRYRPGAATASAKNRRVQRMYAQNRAWLELLRAWSQQETGPLSSEKYNCARGHGWPTRDTLARRFGSWYAALAAAGLSDRAAVSPEVRDARLRGGAQARADRRAARRECVIAAVQRCALALGRFPGPTEYARWRLHNEADAPTFGSAYALFPGGWSDLQAAATA